MLRTVSRVAGAALLLLLAGCGGDSTPTVAPTSPLPSSTSPQPTAPQGTAPPRTVPAATPSAPTGVASAQPTDLSLSCPSNGPSVGFGNVVFGDFDGDGNNDVFRGVHQPRAVLGLPLQQPQRRPVQRLRSAVLGDARGQGSTLRAWLMSSGRGLPPPAAFGPGVEPQFSAL